MAYDGGEVFSFALEDRGTDTLRRVGCKNRNLELIRCAGVGIEPASGSISGAAGTVNENMIPGLFAIGLSLVGLMPFVAGLAHGVEINDQPAIAVPLVSDKLAPLELRKRFQFGVVFAVAVQPDHGRSLAPVSPNLSQVATMTIALARNRGQQA